MTSRLGAVILCAGIGQRLRPLTDDRPKALMDVGGETILGRAVRQLVEVGIGHLVIATGFREDRIRNALAGCPVPVHYCHNPAFDRTQNSVSLWHCREAASAGPFFKLDGDVLFHRDILSRLQRHEGARAGLFAAVQRRDDLGAEEMKVIAEGEAIHAFGKGLDPSDCLGESIGIELVGEEAVLPLFEALGRTIEGGETNLYYEDVYNQLIAKGIDCRAVDVSDLAGIEVDTQEDLDRARQLIADGRLGA